VGRIFSTDFRKILNYEISRKSASRSQAVPFVRFSWDEFSRQIFEKYSTMKFHENPPVEAELFLLSDFRGTNFLERFSKNTQL